MQYPVAIEWGSDDTAIGIVFPDIPGAITAADTLEQAYRDAVEVAHLQLAELAKAGQRIPRPGKVAEHRKRPEFAGFGWGFIEIDVSPYLGRTEKINVTMPGIMIRKIDEYVALHGIKSRSAFLADLAAEKLDV